MKNILAIILCTLLLLGYQARACELNIAEFKNELYFKTYQQSLTHTIQVFSLSNEVVFSSLKAKGVTPFLNQFLNNPTTPAILRECLDEAKHFQFIRNLLIIDSIGKSVGISVGTVAYLGLGKLSFALLNFIIKPIWLISPTIAKKVTQFTLGILAGYTIYKEKVKFDQGEEQAKINGAEILFHLDSQAANISAKVLSLKENEADIQFDISVAKAEKKEGRKLTGSEIEIFCQLIPKAVHRCVHN